jgi:hypothetical protein
MLLGLAQRVRTLQESADNNSPRDTEKPQRGDRVGAFEVTTTQGEVITSASLNQGTSLIGFFAHGCSKCADLRSQLLEQPPRVPMLAIVVAQEKEGDHLQEHNVAKQLEPIARVAVAPVDAPVVKAFRESGFPMLVRVEKGLVAAASHRLTEVMP